MVERPSADRSAPKSFSSIMICTEPSIMKFLQSQHQQDNTMKNRNINALKGFLVGALVALRLSSSAYAAVAHGKTITFDDLYAGAAPFVIISNGYESLTWG